MLRMMAVALCTTLLTPVSARAQSLSGTWTVTAEGAQGTTDEGGTWSMNALSGVLTLTQQGIDVSGSWKGQMPAPWAVSGQLKDRTFELQTEWREIPLTRDGQKSTTRARWVFRGTVSADTLSGTLSLDLQDRAERPQKFTAKRTP
jgi:hypothetical protein